MGPKQGVIGPSQILKCNNPRASSPNGKLTSNSTYSNAGGLTVMRENTNSNKLLSNNSGYKKSSSKDKSKKAATSGIISKSLKMGQVNPKKSINSHSQISKDREDCNTMRNGDGFDTKDYLSENHHLAESDYMSKCRARLANRIKFKNLKRLGLQKKSLD
jgi:hypothetical protein